MQKRDPGQVSFAGESVLRQFGVIHCFALTNEPQRAGFGTALPTDY
jgi:hypothetical protein